MILVFFGTPLFAIPALERLYAHHEIKSVVTQPDKRKGRNLKLSASAVKIRALELDIPVLEPEVLRAPEFLDKLREQEPDAIVVAAYGKILPPEILDLPRFGCINIHGSLLPHYRGAAPIQRAIMDDMDKTGVTIMQMAQGMDTGDIMMQAEVAVAPHDDTASLSVKLAEIGAGLILRTLEDIQSGAVVPRVQDESQATYAPPIAKEESEIIWSRPANTIVNLIRAMSPAPGAYTRWQGKRLKFWKADSVPRKGRPGELLIHENTLLIGTGLDALEVLEIQPEGKKRMTATEFVRGYRPNSGDKLA
jgi:methionyl-tRNA formyltransferase